MKLKHTQSQRTSRGLTSWVVHNEIPTCYWRGRRKVLYRQGWQMRDRQCSKLKHFYHKIIYMTMSFGDGHPNSIQLGRRPTRIFQDSKAVQRELEELVIWSRCWGILRMRRGPAPNKMTTPSRSVFFGYTSGYRCYSICAKRLNPLRTLWLRTPTFLATILSPYLAVHSTVLRLGRPGCEYRSFR